MITVKDWYKWRHLPLTADQYVSKRPCWVKHICLTANADGAATVLVYDGNDTSGKLKLALSAIASTHFNDDFDVPIFFEQGIYVDVGSNVTLFNIQFLEADGE